VIGLITRSGETTDLSASIPAAGEVRRITGHDAFAQLCATRPEGEACTNPYVAASMPPSSPEQSLSSSEDHTLGCAATTTTTCGGAPVVIHGCAEAGAAPMNVPAPSPWLRPQPDIPYCPVCPIKGGKLTLSLNPDHSAGTSVFGFTVLNNPMFEFRLADGNYVRAGLGPLVVDADGEDVDLAGYMITIDGETRSIAEALAANNVTAATLGFYVGDGTSGSTRATSAVSVRWDAESSSSGDDTTGGDEWGTTSGDDSTGAEWGTTGGDESTGAEWGTTSGSSEYESTGAEWGTTSGSSGYESTGTEWSTTSESSGYESTGAEWGTTSGSSGWGDSGTESTTSTGTSG
jgi:hypothetical protein